MTTDDIKTTIGEIGERHIFNLFNGIPSIDKYDPLKDGMINALSAQVKTIRINLRMQGF